MRSGFGSIPQVKFNRSKFDLSHTVKTSLNVGDLVPLDWVEVIPGDTFTGSLRTVARLSTSFIRPPMDNLYIEQHHFFIPNRLTFSDSEKVFGVASPSSYTQDLLEEYPMINKPCYIYPGSVGDYLGLKPGFYPANSLSLLPFRAFALVYNQWFRNENVIDEVYVQTGEAKDSEVPNDQPWSPNNYVGMLPKVCKKKDYFTSCLPQPQKGTPVALPLAGNAPVRVSPEVTSQYHLDANFMPMFGETTVAVGPNDFNPVSLGAFKTSIDTSTDNSVFLETPNGPSDRPIALKLGTPENPYLYSDMSSITMASINDLRYGFALQRMLERDALYGSRYNSYLLGHFGVQNPDARLQFTEYLGGGRIPINIYQVAQTMNSESQQNKLGTLGAYSVTDGSSKFSKGFTEHGIFLTVCFIRQLHTYQDGVAKKWRKKARNDFYDPLFSTIGEQPVYTSELVYNSTQESQPSLTENVFGYNEAWADYRNIPNSISGEMRSGVSNSLDIWHFADSYDSVQYLNKGFIEETSDFVNRTIDVPSTSQDSFILDCYFVMPTIRVMPTYSIPSLIDHH